MNKDITLSETASGLIFAGFAKLDNLYLGVGLIAVGVIIKVMVAWLQKRGLEVQSQPLG
jgi:hypothetical protein